MKKSELIARAAVQAGMKKKDMELAFDALAAVLCDAIAEGKRITIPGLGTFDTKIRPAREGHIPSTGEKIEISAANIPVFRPAKQLKEKCNP